MTAVIVADKILLSRRQRDWGPGLPHFLQQPIFGVSVIRRLPCLVYEKTGKGYSERAAWTSRCKTVRRTAREMRKAAPVSPPSAGAATAVELGGER